VEYNTSTNPTFEGAVRDTSGRGLDGVLYGGASYDATQKALVFDGTDDFTRVLLPPSAKGNWIHSVSCWVKADVITGEEAVWNIGQLNNFSVNSRQSTLAFNKVSPTLRWYFYGNDSSTNLININENEWNHIVLVYKGGTSSDTSKLLYVNGVKVLLNSISGTAAPLDLKSDDGTGVHLMLGNLPWGTGSRLDGAISQFKLYDCVLTAEEVKTLYDMGRCDEGHHVVNFSKTRVGIGLGDGEAPRGALDVRGDLYLSGNIIRNTSSAKSGGTWIPTYQFEVGSATFVETSRHGQYHIINNQLTAVYQATVVSNSGAGTIRASLPGGIRPAGYLTPSTIVVGFWTRKSDIGVANVGPYLATAYGDYISLFQPGQTNNSIRMDGASLEAGEMWTIFLSYTVE